MQPAQKKHKINIMVLVLLTGLIVGIYALFCVYKGYESQTWPQTQGEIIYSRITGSTRIIGRKASIKYAYVVHGERHVSSLVSFTWKSVDHQGFLELLRDYPEGKEVMVFYNPAKPQQAVLKTDISRHIWWLFLFSTLTIIIGTRGLLGRRRATVA